MNKIMSYPYTASLLALAILFFLSGCAPSLVTGKKFETTYITNIKKGVTTKTEILRMFDEPFSKKIRAGKETWQYFYKSFESTPNAASYIPIAGNFVGHRDNKGEHSSLLLVLDKNIVTGCTFTYGSSASRSSHLNVLNQQQTAPTTEVTEPCGE